MKAGDVAARMSEACNKDAADRIGDDGKYDRDGARFPLQCRCNRGPECQDHVRLRRYQFLGEFPHQLDIVAGPANFDLHVSSGCPTEFGKTLRERGQPCLRSRIAFVECQQHTDPPRTAGLRKCGERPPGSRASK